MATLAEMKELAKGGKLEPGFGFGLKEEKVSAENVLIGAQTPEASMGKMHLHGDPEVTYLFRGVSQEYVTSMAETGKEPVFGKHGELLRWKTIGQAEKLTEKQVATEHIQKHQEMYGAGETGLLQNQLSKMYSDQYAVVQVKPGVTVVVDSNKDEVDVLYDQEITPVDKAAIIKSIDVAGDVPNRTVFIRKDAKQAATGPVGSEEYGWSGLTGSSEEPGVSVVSSGGGALPGSGTSMLLLIVAGIAALWYIFARRK